MKQVTIYTKPGCHLCEEGHQLLLNVAAEIPVQIVVIDISQAKNRDFHAKYFLQIPVLAFPDPDRELAWPFTAADIRACLNQN